MVYARQHAARRSNAAHEATSTTSSASTAGYDEAREALRPNALLQLANVITPVKVLGIPPANVAPSDIADLTGAVPVPGELAKTGARYVHSRWAARTPGWTWATPATRWRWAAWVRTSWAAADSWQRAWTSRRGFGGTAPTWWAAWSV